VVQVRVKGEPLIRSRVRNCPESSGTRNKPKEIKDCNTIGAVTRFLPSHARNGTYRYPRVTEMMCKGGPTGQPRMTRWHAPSDEQRHNRGRRSHAKLSSPRSSESMGDPRGSLEPRRTDALSATAELSLARIVGRVTVFGPDSPIRRAQSLGESWREQSGAGSCWRADRQERKLTAKPALQLPYQWRR
jgi:hypothetical protein